MAVFIAKFTFCSNLGPGSIQEAIMALRHTLEQLEGSKIGLGFAV